MTHQIEPETHYHGKNVLSLFNKIKRRSMTHNDKIMKLDRDCNPEAPESRTQPTSVLSTTIETS